MEKLSTNRVRLHFQWWFEFLHNKYLVNKTFEFISPVFEVRKIVRERLFLNPMFLHVPPDRFELVCSLMRWCIQNENK